MAAHFTAGVRIGHATDEEHHTGCTVFVLPEGSVGGVDVRGSAPGSRETEVLDPVKCVPCVTAIMLSGGSALGLATADGAARNLLNRGYGFQTSVLRVPIIPAAVLYDLHVHRSHNFPTADMGSRAVDAAFADTSATVLQGNVGAGAGATCGKWKGFDHCMKSGFGFACERLRTVEVFAAAVVNPVGDIIEKDGTVLAGARDHTKGTFFGDSVKFPVFPQYDRPLQNTTLVVIGTTAKLDKPAATRLAQRGHDALANAIKPVHTTNDGDTVFAVSTGDDASESEDNLAHAACYCVEEAIRNAVRFAQCIDRPRSIHSITAVK